MNEQEVLHTLRLIYADLTAKANICRAKAEMFTRGEPDSAILLHCKAETYASAASTLKSYCRRIGFDPSTKGEKE